jgi:hypothetical protein
MLVLVLVVNDEGKGSVCSRCNKKEILSMDYKIIEIMIIIILIMEQEEEDHYLILDHLVITVYEVQIVLAGHHHHHLHWDGIGMNFM